MSLSLLASADATLAAIYVSDDTRLLVILAVGSLAVIPAFGGLFLWVACKILKAKRVSYARAWLAYLSAFLAASVVGTVLGVFLISSRTLPPWFVWTVYGQAVAMHFVVVPLVLRIGRGKGMLAHVMALVMFALVAVAALTPLVRRASRAAQSAVASADVHMAGRAVQEYCRQHDEVLPPDLKTVEKAGFPIVRPGKSGKAEMAYVIEYLQRRYKDPGAPKGTPIKIRIHRLNPTEAPMIWVPLEGLGEGTLRVCYMDGSTRTVSQTKLDSQLAEVVKELGLEPIE